MMQPKRRVAGLHPAWWTPIFVAGLIGVVVLVIAAYDRRFTPHANVTVTSDRAGLMMEAEGAVKFRGITIGRVSSVEPGIPVKLQLELNADQLKYIPANVEAEITAPTVFGNKYVELVSPSKPSPQRLARGAQLAAREVSIEANTVLQNVVGLLNQIDPAKLNAVLSAVAEGVAGKGEAIGQAATDFNQVLMQINPRRETIRADLRAFKGFADTYSGAAQNLLTTLSAVSTTSTTITNNAKTLDALLLNVIGLSNSGINVIGPNKDNLVRGINGLEPTTRLLMKYNPELTCTLVGGAKVLDKYDWGGVFGLRNGKSLILDVALLPGEDPYRYPDNLPINGVKGGPGGAPGCGSLPDVADNWPVRYVVTNSGWGGGLDERPNPGIGFPGWADFFPVTRGTPKPPSIRHPGGPAPGPVPYPGAPPYGAPRYAADGTPLYPGLPPAPPPGRPREPGPPPAGSEPFVPAHPGTQPTCGILTQVCGPPPLPPPPPPQTASAP